ncbi:hypothetical protein [Saccharothrix australiensis]|uniref:Uncharacterized protein n=1 Tax=Saccharothrix australiensis TaxID=2072 RepID=A0A495VXS2_9PSEU|nr:hypothetical protein [Saccharothrix australiensis]RKT53630.1 hypothetical protein C8E97_2202 [Saccharothrix australiensis]
MLQYRDRVLVNFRDFAFAERGGHGFRWVDVKRFGTSAAADRELLRALVGDVRFRDDYAGGGVDPAGTRHGPYWLDRVTAEAFEPVAEAEAVEVLGNWASGGGEVPADLAEVLEREVFGPVREATGRYRLKDLGRTAFHDWGGVHGEFHEFVLVDRAAGSLSLLVAADD